MKKLISLLLALMLLVTGAVSLASCQPEDDDTPTVEEYTRTENGVTYKLRLLSDGSFTMEESYTATVDYDATKGDAGKLTSNVVKNYTGTWTKATEEFTEGENTVEKEIITLKYTGGKLRDEVFATNPSSAYNPVLNFHASLQLYQRYLIEVLGMKESAIGTQYYAPAEFTVTFADNSTLKFYEFLTPGSTAVKEGLYGEEGAKSFVNAEKNTIGFTLENGQTVTFPFNLAKYGESVTSVKLKKHDNPNPSYTETTYTVTLGTPKTKKLSPAEMGLTTDLTDAQKKVVSFQKSGSTYSVTLDGKNDSGVSYKGSFTVNANEYGAAVDSVKWVPAEGTAAGHFLVTFKNTVEFTVKDALGDTAVKADSLTKTNSKDGMDTYSITLKNGSTVIFTVPTSKGAVSSVAQTATSLDCVFLRGDRTLDKTELPTENLRIEKNVVDNTFSIAPDKEEHDH